MDWSLFGWVGVSGKGQSPYLKQNKIGHSSRSSSNNQRSKKTADQRCLLITILKNDQKTNRPEVKDNASNFFRLHRFNIQNTQKFAINFDYE